MLVPYCRRTQFNQQQAPTDKQQSEQTAQPAQQHGRVSAQAHPVVEHTLSSVCTSTTHHIVSSILIRSLAIELRIY